MMIAFKEWAVICAALASGRQTLILRKGGIAETDGEFRPEHDRFLLYPTYFHEHRNGIKPAFQPLLDECEANKPAPGTVRLTNTVQVKNVELITDLNAALALDAEHAWTAEEVTKRFNYRKPGLFVLRVAVEMLAAPLEVVERPEYAGCKTWVELS